MPNNSLIPSFQDRSKGDMRTRERERERERAGHCCPAPAEEANFNGVDSSEFSSSCFLPQGSSAHRWCFDSVVGSRGRPAALLPIREQSTVRVNLPPRFFSSFLLAQSSRVYSHSQLYEGHCSGLFVCVCVCSPAISLPLSHTLRLLARIFNYQAAPAAATDTKQVVIWNKWIFLWWPRWQNPTRHSTHTHTE